MEKDLEKRCCDYAERLGWKQRKFTSPGHRGAFDRIFIKGRVLFVEFKSPGEDLSPLQRVEYNDLRDHSACVSVIDSYAQFIQLLAYS